MKIKPHLVIQPEKGQRVFFCGDVHGDKAALERRLNQVGFVEREDMLIFTGDLIDRGKHSAELIEYATCTPGVYSVIGNHESMFLYGMLDALYRTAHISPSVGGAWIEQHSKSELEELAELIQNHMSIAITVEAPDYTIGVLHAAAPDDWQSIIRPTTEDEEEWLWSRQQYEETRTGKSHFVKGLDAVIHGHVADHVTVGGNHVWIDTLMYTGALTIIEALDVLACVEKEN